MPLIQSGSEEAIRENIAALIREGKSPEQAAAIAYSIARENDLEGSGCRVGGEVIVCGERHAPLLSLEIYDYRE